MSREAIEGLRHMVPQRVPGHPRVLVLEPPTTGTLTIRTKDGKFLSSFRLDADFTPVCDQIIREARAELLVRYTFRALGLSK
jgi:hypothetical protein